MDLFIQLYEKKHFSISDSWNTFTQVIEISDLILHKWSTAKICTTTYCIMTLEVAERDFSGLLVDPVTDTSRTTKVRDKAA